MLVLGPKHSSVAPRMGLAIVAFCLALALLPAFVATPNTVNEICGHEEFKSMPLVLNAPGL